MPDNGSVTVMGGTHHWQKEKSTPHHARQRKLTSAHDGSQAFLIRGLKRWWTKTMAVSEAALAAAYEAAAGGHRKRRRSIGRQRLPCETGEQTRELNSLNAKGASQTLDSELSAAYAQLGAPRRKQGRHTQHSAPAPQTLPKTHSSPPPPPIRGWPAGASALIRDLWCTYEADHHGDNLLTPTLQNREGSKIRLSHESWADRAQSDTWSIADLARVHRERKRRARSVKGSRRRPGARCTLLDLRQIRDLGHGTFRRIRHSAANRSGRTRHFRRNRCLQR